MKKIINGKKYDTETAQRIDSKGNGKYRNDIYCSNETLFKKKTGEYFLYIEGGHVTKFSEERFEVYGEQIIDGIAPLSEYYAKKWAEEAMDGDEFERIFGEVAE